MKEYRYFKAALLWSAMNLGVATYVAVIYTAQADEAKYAAMVFWLTVAMLYAYAAILVASGILGAMCLQVLFPIRQRAAA